MEAAYVLNNLLVFINDMLSCTEIFTINYFFRFGNEQIYVAFNRLVFQPHQPGLKIPGAFL